MKNIIFCLFALFTLTGCTENDDESFTGGNGSLTILQPYPDSVIDSKLFDVIDLDRTGLEKVKAHYESGELYFAAQELLNYYRLRNHVTNPSLSLFNVTASSDDRLKADYAMDKSRFFVNNFYEDSESKKPYSLEKEGKIDWAFVPQNASDEYQKQLHRHQWFIPQAKVYRVTADEKYIQSWINVYTDWLKQNPIPATGPNTTTWWQLQVAARISDQVELFEYYKNSVHFTPQWLSVFLVNFARHADFLKQYPYKSEGNILISQANALAYAGTLFPEFKNAASWMKEGFGILSQQAGKQFLSDGMHIELSLHYHISTLADFYSAMKLAEANNLRSKLPANLSESLEKAAETVIHFTYPTFFNTKSKEYCVPAFNDSWKSNWTRSVLTRNFKRYLEMFPTNKDLRYMVYPQGPAPDTRMKLFDRAGFYVMRNGWDESSTMLIHSNNAKTSEDNLKLYSHNQPDNGTFELYHNGRNFFPDAGVCSYSGNSAANELRKWFRQTKVHNTLTLDGKNITHADGRLLKSEEGSNELIVTENAGYSDLTHRRAIFFVDKKFFVLIDEGIGNASGTVNLNFNLLEGNDSEVVVDQLANGAHTAFTDGNNLLVRTFSDSPLTCVPFESRVSYAVDGKYTTRRAYSVDIKKATDKTARYITVLLPVEGTTEMATVTAKFTEEYKAEGSSVEVTVNGKKYNLAYTL